MKRFFRWLLFPTGALLVVVAAERSLPTGGSVPSSIPDVEDAKLRRTLAGFDLGTGFERDGAAIEVRLSMGDAELRALRDQSRKRMEVGIAFGASRSQRALVKSRGKGSFLAEWKSLSVRLTERDVSLDGVELDRFWLLNLASDPYGFEMYTSYTLLREIGLFPPLFRYANVRVNAEPAGIFLLIERPEDAIRRFWPDVRSILRLRLNGVEVKYSDGASDPFRLVRDLEQPEGGPSPAEEMAKLERVMDLDGYLRWLAFNSLVENADSRNELFLFELGGEGGRGRLRLLPWDYDDLQEAPTRPADVLEDPLLYASEMELDRRVQTNPRLYARYKVVLRELLEQRLTEERLTRTLEEVGTRLNTLEPDAGGREDAMRRFEDRLLERRRILLALVSEGV